MISVLLTLFVVPAVYTLVAGEHRSPHYLRDLIARYSTREVLELRFSADGNEAAAAQLTGIGDRLELLPDRVLIYADDGETALAETHHRGLSPESALVRRSSLEDVFLQLTGRSLAD